MGRPYSLDLRERVVTAMTAGMSGQQAAQQFSIGESSALRWARRARGHSRWRPIAVGLPPGRETRSDVARARGGTKGAWRQR